MAEESLSSQVTADLIIDPKRSSTTSFRTAISNATGYEQWLDNDQWNYFLIKRKEKAQASKEMPEWAKTLLKYDKGIEWMRRQHWKHNKNSMSSRLGKHGKEGNVTRNS
ncbi:hypothetical protein B7463_g1866, partial [Scytalidium lignicola]